MSSPIRSDASHQATLEAAFDDGTLSLLMRVDNTTGALETYFGGGFYAPLPTGAPTF